MTTDVTANQLLRAAVDGVIDFNRARPHEARWWRRTQALLRCYEAKTNAELMALEYHRVLAAYGRYVPGQPDDYYDRCLKIAADQINGIEDCLRPWAAQGRVAAREAADRKLARQYEEAYGNDPEAVQRTVAYLRELRAYNRRQAEEED